jgi:hypothetical protein
VSFANNNNNVSNDDDEATNRVVVVDDDDDDANGDGQLAQRNASDGDMFVSPQMQFRPRKVHRRRAPMFVCLFLNSGVGSFLSFFSEPFFFPVEARVETRQRVD